MQIDKRKVYIAAAVIVGLLIALFVYLDLKKGRLTITTSENGSIYVFQGSTGSVELIGVGEATFKTGSKDPIYVSVEEGSKKTHSVYTVGDWDRRTESVELSELKNKEQVAKAALSNIHIENDFIYGTDPYAQTLIYYPRGSKQTSDVKYSELPAIKSIDWVNRKNFVFNGFGIGVSYYIDGSIREFENLVETEELDKTIGNYATNDPKKSILLFNQKEIFRTEGLNDLKPEKVGNYSGNESTTVYDIGRSSVAVTPNYDDNPGAESEEAQSDEGVIQELISSTNFAIIDYDGSIEGEFALPIHEEVLSVAPYRDLGVVALTGGSVFLIDFDGNEFTELPLYIQNAHDAIAYGDDIVILNEEGLWKYDISKRAIQLMADYIEGEEYAPDSLRINGGNVLYSTVYVKPGGGLNSLDEIVEDGGSDPGYIYSVDLD